MSRILVNLGAAFVVLTGMPAPLSALPANQVQRCIKRVSNQYAPLEGRATLKQQQRFQAHLARCTSPGLTWNQAVCVGAARYDLTRLASLLMKKQITPAQYLQRIRDRNRKADRCLRDARWSAAYLRGDRDGDLVPDAYDRCPRTPQLTATSDRGCSVAEPQVSEGPSPQDVDDFFKLHTTLPNPNCASGSVPTVPAVRRFASVNWPTISPAKLRSEFRGAVNQPPACPVVYQVWVEEVMRAALDNPAEEHRMPISITFLLKSKDALRIDGDNFTFETEHDRLDALFHQGARAKIRSINGLGLASAWSEFVRIPGR